MNNLFRNTAWLYDYDERDNLTADIPFYIDYAQAAGGEVLELGCGTGRVALALARKGFRVTGLDLSREMLAVFEDKLGREAALRDRVTLAHGDMAAFDLGRTFALIIAPFRAFQAVTGDGDTARALACVRRHLAPGGRFILNVFQPHDVMDESWRYPEQVQWERDDEAAGRRIVKTHWGDRIDTERQIIYPHFAYYVTEPDGRTERYTEDLALKYYREPQLEAAVVEAGMLVEERYGWYDKSPSGIGREIIFVCGRDGE